MLPITSGFTLIELLVVIAIIAVLAGLLWPVLGRTKSKPQGIACLNNLRQVMLAWRTYAEDNDGRLVASNQSLPGRPSWFTGELNFTADPVNWSITNDMIKSPLWPYTGQCKNIFKCPSDRATVTVQGQKLPRIRSLSLAQHFGFGGWLPAPPYRTYARFDDMLSPPPAMVWVLVDEHPDSINDAALPNQMVTAARLAEARIIDFPASSHNGACGFSFADGHSEIKKWTDRRTIRPVKYNGALNLNVPSPNHRDVLWLAERSSTLTGR